MAPSPAAGKTPSQAPKTPTKQGKTPASKLGQAKSNTPKPPQADKAKSAAGDAKPSNPSDVKSPKLPPRPKPGQAQQAKGAAQKTGQDAKKKTEDAAEGAKDAVAGADEDEDDKDVTEKAKSAAGGVADQAKGTAQQAKDTAGDAVDDAKDTAEDAKDGAKDDVEATAEDAKDSAEDAAPDEAEDAIPDEAKDAAEGTKDTAENVEDEAEGAVSEAEDAADDAKDNAEDVAEDVKDTADEVQPDLSVLKGLQVGEGGEILDADGNPLGQLDEGDPEDLVGKEIGDDGEILDGDGDVIGRASVLPDKAQELADKAKDELPEVNVLEGLEVGAEGDIMGPDGTPLGKITEGNPEDLVGMTLNENGEILDEDGDVIGRAEVVPGEAAEKLKAEAEEGLGGLKPDLSILSGRKINKKGNILDEEGEPIGKLAEGSDVSKCAGKIPNENGEIVDDDGNVVGRVEVVPGDAADDAMKALHPELLEDVEGAAEETEKPSLPGLDVVEGLKLNKKGEVLNEEGEPIAKLAEGELSDCLGKKLNDKGEFVDSDGNVVGRVELIPEAFPEAEVEEPEPVDLSILDGLKVNKKGEVLNEDGEVVGRLSDGELQDCIGKKLNEKGEVLDTEGNVIGKVELTDRQDQEDGEEQGEDFTSLEGYKINKSGKVVNEDGEILAKLVEGEIEECAGKKVNEKGEVVDADGNVIGRVELGSDDEEEELPPLSILEGCKCNKNGKLVDEDGNPRGELIEGDAKKINKMGAECDAEGQFWDGKGNVIGRAKTLPAKDDEEDAPFAGLEGLIVVEGGLVEDENQNKVGKLVDGDEKKLVGRAVDEDGDVIDKHGNVVGHAERLPEEEEAEKPDLSVLEGMPVNKQGNVIGDEGVPIGRLVEGNAKDLAGRKCDAEGQIWNDSGKVIGRVELIPEDEREAKPEGPFAGLEGCVVVKNGMVEDEEGNTVGQVVEGDAKKLVGRAVDEDGDIIDKYGNVKGHAERYEEPEEEVADLSSLEGKIVNKSGNVVDEHGTVFGRIVEGDPKELAGKHVDGQGQIWNESGKVIGQAELIPGGGTQKPEGPFAGFEGLVVAKDGLVTDAQGQVVGKLVEGSDPQKLLGRKVDEDGDIIDKTGNAIGQAERYSPEEKKRDVNPMAGRKVNKDGEVRDENGELLGMVTDGHLPTLIGKEVDDNGYVIDNDGNRIGECTLMQNLPDEEEEEMTEEELQKKKDAEIAKKMNGIVVQTIEKMDPICKDITNLIEAAERKPKEELDEEELVKQVKPKIEEGNRHLQECNGAIRGLDPDGSIAQNAKARAASGEASKEEHQLANSLKELTSNIVTTIENAKKKINDMPHAKKKLNPLWGLLTEPLFQIIAAVGLLLAGVLGLVGKLLGGLGLGGLVNGLLGGLGIDKLLDGSGLGGLMGGK